MSLPVLQNPISVIIEKIDKSKTNYNNRLRENVNIIRRKTPIAIDAQIVWKRSISSASKDGLNFEGSQNFGLAGISEESIGYFIVRFLDLNKLELVIEKGDKIIKLGQIDTEYFVLGTRPAAHYVDQRGFALLMIFFKDRNP